MAQTMNLGRPAIPHNFLIQTQDKFLWHQQLYFAAQRRNPKGIIRLSRKGEKRILKIKAPLV